MTLTPALSLRIGSISKERRPETAVIFSADWRPQFLEELFRAVNMKIRMTL